MQSAKTIVWPVWQRLLHWLLAGSVATALITNHGGTVHEWAGYVALALALVRITLGFVGPPVARFTSFLKTPLETWHYTLQMLKSNEPRFLNHNPLGAWMVALLLCTITSCAAIGWASITDQLWGLAWVMNVHAVLGWSLLVMIVTHLLGVAWASWRHRENLVASMLHGKKSTDDNGF